MGREHHHGAGHVDEAGGADADRGHVVLPGEAGDHVDDGVLDLADVASLRRTAVQSDDLARRVDHRAEHLGAADVDADRERLPARGAGAARTDLGHALRLSIGRRRPVKVGVGVLKPR